MAGYCLVTLLLLTITTGCLTQIIPKRPFGYVYNGGSNDALVWMDAHMGPLCPDSADALPTLRTVADHYGQNTLKLTLHMFPLPYHHQAYLTSIGAQAVRMLGTPAKTFEWFSTIYNNLNSLSNDAVANMTQTEIINLLASYAAKSGINELQFKQQMSSGELENDVRAAWKYSCSRAIFGTPTFLINDVKVEGSPMWTLQDWMKVIDPLLVPSIGNRNVKKCATGTVKCEYLPGKIECCTKGENCIPNVGCRCLGEHCLNNKLTKCATGTVKCEYLPGKIECCTKGENCIPNVGCRCLGEHCLKNNLTECPVGSSLCETLSGVNQCCDRKHVCLSRTGCTAVSDLLQRITYT